MLQIHTIERPPFAFREGGMQQGFSIDLMRLIAEELGRPVRFTFVDTFPEMLGAVERGEVDGAIANISITSERETVLDFSRPVYESGLKIMVHGQVGGSSLLQVLLRWELFALLLAEFGVLFALGMIMWVFERKRQPYFDHEAKEAMFPAFWWALHLVINGGFELAVPRSALGRLLGVVMVVSSLFLVSIFVAQLTAALTIEAIEGNIQALSDLDGRPIGTTAGSTASSFLSERDISHQKFEAYGDLIAAFEQQRLDAVVFDGPILAHYLSETPGSDASLLNRVFRPEDYGIALPQGSELREPINRILLRLNETGDYEAVRRRWFGSDR